MKIVTPPLVVELSDSFSNDLLDRRTYGVALLNLVQRSSDELVISLDGKWGEGKTTFVKMWQGLLSEAKIPSIYIDAFANDYIDDAFISVASAITAFVDDNIEKSSDEKATELKEKAKSIGGKLVAWSTKIAIKAATLGAIKDSDIEEFQEIRNDIANGTSGFLGKLIEDKLTSHAKDVLLVDDFRNLLSDIPSKLEGSNENPLIIIIDELDRCRPSFAIEMLEKIKHLFSVKNVVFVLVMHKEQLEEAVRSIYGQNIDAHTYLQKFINVEAKLPKQIGKGRGNDLETYSRKLLQLHELETWGDDRNIVDCIEPLANHFNLSLRQLEKVYTNLALFYGSSGERQLRLVPIIVFLSVIKAINSNLFDKLYRQRITYEGLCKETGIHPDEEKDRKLFWLMNWIRYALLSENEFNALGNEDRIKTFGESLWNYNVERERLIPIFSQQLSMFVVK